MKFVYDILLNFNDVNMYEFYEWSTDDDIEYFKKIPLFKVDNNTYRKIAINSIIREEKFLEKISNLTEIYDKKRIRRIPYATILTNGKESLAVILNNEGRIIMISKMLVDEEDETLDMSYLLENQELNIGGDHLSCNEEIFLTRLERKKMFFINKELDELYNKKNIVKLKYLYYECFNKMEDDIDVINNDFNKFMKSDWAFTHDKLYDLVRLSYSKK